MAGKTLYIPPTLVQSNTAAKLASYTPRLGELVFDATNERLYIGDGETLGGIAVGSSSGSSYNARYDVRSYSSVVIDGSTDAAPALTLVAETISSSGGGILSVRSDDLTDKIYFNSRFKIPSNVLVEFFNPVLFGEYGMIGIQGELDEIPETDKYRILTAVSAGDTLIPLSTGSAYDYTNFDVGNKLIFRGENDAAGNALWKDEVNVVSVLSSSNSLVITPALANDYEPVYSASVYSASVDRTTISIVVGALMSAGASRGDTQVGIDTVANLTVGDYVMLEDNKKGLDVSGTSNNQIHREPNQIIALDSGTNIVTLAFPLAHDYESAYNAILQKMSPVINAGVINAKCTFATNSVNNNKYSFFTQFAIRPTIYNCEVTGIASASLGPKSHCFRLGEGTLYGIVDNCRVDRPQFYSSGQGYGATIYAARQCVIRNSWFNGCRHSILLFTGACENLIEGNISIDARISDYDLHGAEEVDNVFIGNQAIGGESTSPDASDKAAYKIGNTTHRVGSHGNVFIGNIASKHSGYLCYILAASKNNVVTENTAIECDYGVYVNRLSTDSAMICEDNTITSNLFIKCGQMLDLDGGSGGKSVRDTVFAGNTSVEHTGSALLVDVDYASGLLLKNNTVERAQVHSATSYLYDIRESVGVKIQNEDINGGTGFLYAKSCPSILITGVTLSNLSSSSRTVLNDAGGNDSGKLLNYECLDFDASFTLSSATTGFVFRARAVENTDVVFSASTPYSITSATTGSSGVISVVSTLPVSTQGVVILSGTLKPKAPKSKIRYKAEIPYVFASASAQTCTIAPFFYDASTSTALPYKIVRVGSGATSGTGGEVSGVIQHNNTDLSSSVTIEIRFGNTDSTLEVQLGSRGASAGLPRLHITEDN